MKALRNQGSVGQGIGREMRKNVGQNLCIDRLAYMGHEDPDARPLGKSDIPFPVFSAFPEPCKTVKEGPPCRFLVDRFSAFSCSDILSTGEPV